MRVLITAEATPSASGLERARALETGWRRQRSGDVLDLAALSGVAADAAATWPNRVVSVGRSVDDLDAALAATNPHTLLHLADVAADAVSFHELWRHLRARCRGWAGVRRWLSSAGGVLAETPRPLLGADSALARLAVVDPAGAEREREALTGLLDDIEREARNLPLLDHRSPGRAAGSGAGWGLGQIALSLGIPVRDACASIADAILSNVDSESLDLHIHVGSRLNTWDLPDSVVARAAEMASSWGLPFVAVATEVGIGSRERGTWGIDGALEARDTPEDLRAAGERLARTWSLPPR